MKKIILGLFLTVGFTAVATANTISDVPPSLEGFELVCGVGLSTNKGNTEDLKKKMCDRKVSTRIYNCDGTFTSSFTLVETVECPIGLEEGDLTVLILREYPANCP